MARYGKGGNTKAGVSCFDGTDGPAKPKRYESGQRQGDLSGSHARGSDAGGKDSPRNTRRSLSGKRFSAPESGSAHARPTGVSAHDGVSAGRGAKKPA